MAPTWSSASNSSGDSVMPRKSFCSLAIYVTKKFGKGSLAFSTIAAALFFSPTLRAQQPDPNPIPPPSQPAPNSPSAPSAPVAPTSPGAGGSSSSNMMRTWRKLTYTCDGNTKVVVNLHAKQARVVFNGHTYNMKQTDDSDGQKFFGDSFVWQVKGEDGSLGRSSKSGSNNKTVAANCHLQSAGTDSTAPTKPRAAQP
jgi:membrane-bound inhibitor of C-type lysozyme